MHVCGFFSFYLQATGEDNIYADITLKSFKDIPMADFEVSGREAAVTPLLFQCILFHGHLFLKIVDLL